MEAMDDAAIRDLVIRLSRPHRSGGKVIERAAILAEGAAAAGVVDWILSRSGEPEVRCRCGKISSWTRETAKVGEG